MQFKRIVVRVLASFLRNFSKVGKLIYRKSNVLTRFFKLIGKLTFDFLIFPVYRGVHLVRAKLFNVYSPAKRKVYSILNRNYFIHAIVVILGISVVFNSISAKELREENFGEQTIIYSVMTKDPTEVLTEETSVVSSGDQIISYLDKTAVVETTLGSMETAEKVEESLIGEVSTVIEGGSALIKPNIIEPIKVSDLPAQQNTQIRSGITKYTVQAGETISEIAKKFGITSQTILWQNSLGERSLIHEGDVLEILPESGLAHKVTSGQNLGAIANKYDVEVEEIVTANNLFDVNDIKIGQQLLIPGGVKTSPYVAKPTYASNVPKVSPISKLFVPPSQSATAGTGYLWPAGVRRISQYYSWRHRGLDLAGPTGTAIYATDGGTVTYSGWSNGYGYNILIDHGNGVKTRYAHASKLHVSVGEKVAKGQTIMSMGSTGWSTGPHLHFEIIIGGDKKNPLSYIK
jgi:LysM repeat protein